jgi:hypothetical protein
MKDEVGFDDDAVLESERFFAHMKDFLHSGLNRRAIQKVQNLVF